MTVLVSSRPRPRSRAKVGESRVDAPQFGGSIDEIATEAGMADRHELDAAVQAWADQITAIRKALDANHIDMPSASAVGARGGTT